MKKVKDRRRQAGLEALNWLGVPFKHQGRSREIGVDCVGLVACVGAECGYIDLDEVSSDYPSEFNPQRISQGMGLHLNPARRSEPDDGDVLLLRFSHGGPPQHLAIYIDGYIVHSYGREGKVVKHRFSNAWKARLVGIWCYE